MQRAPFYIGYGVMLADHMKRVAIFGIDNFSLKNLHQLNVLNPEGYRYDVFTSDCRHDSKRNILKTIYNVNRLYILKRSFMARIFQIVRYLIKYSHEIVHVEIYPGGRFAFIYMIASKIAMKKSIVVERGDLVDIDIYPAMTKISMRICYRYADVVWFREIYMKEKLKVLGARKTVFIHNVIPVPLVSNTSFNKKFTFLWANRLIRQRRSDWLIDILSSDSFKNLKHAILGLEENVEAGEVVDINQRYVINRSPANVSVVGFVDPLYYYMNSKFFVLPAEVVFCNNSLIESMSYGVVPLISNVEGADMIVDDGIDGFIFEHSYEGLQLAMKRALALGINDYEVMSNNAIDKIRNRFNIITLRSKMLSMYEGIH